jgi:hypothetical protein
MILGCVACAKAVRTLLFSVLLRRAPLVPAWCSCPLFLLHFCRCVCAALSLYTLMLSVSPCRLSTHVDSHDSQLRMCHADDTAALWRLALGAPLLRCKYTI